MKNKIYYAFDQIHAEDALKQRTMESVFKNMEKRERRMFVRRKYAYALSAIMLFLCVGLGSHQLYFTEVFALSVDVNPSIELGINRFDKVISVDSYNEDGDIITSSVDIKHMKYADAVDSIVVEEQRYGYLENNDEVSITVDCSRDEKYEEIEHSISTCQIQENQQVLVEKHQNETVSEAHDNGLSFGKYQAFQKLQAVKPEVTVDEVKTMTMKEIKTATLEVTDTAQPPADSSSSASDSDEETSTSTSASTSTTTDSKTGSTTDSSSTAGSSSSTSSGSSSSTSFGSTPVDTTGSSTSNTTGEKPGEKPSENTDSSKPAKDKVESSKDNVAPGKGDTNTNANTGNSKEPVNGATTENQEGSDAESDKGTETDVPVTPDPNEDVILEESQM